MSLSTSSISERKVIAPLLKKDKHKHESVTSDLLSGHLDQLLNISTTLIPAGLDKKISYLMKDLSLSALDDCFRVIVCVISTNILWNGKCKNTLRMPKNVTILIFPKDSTSIHLNLMRAKQIMSKNSMCFH